MKLVNRPRRSNCPAVAPEVVSWSAGGHLKMVNAIWITLAYLRE
jgi:hypothetical protein